MDISKPGINYAPLMDFYNKVNFRRIYNFDEIRQLSYVDVYFNKTKARVSATSQLPMYDEIERILEYPEGHAYHGYEFEPLIVLVDIEFSKDRISRSKTETSINNDNLKYIMLNDISCRAYLRNNGKSEGITISYYECPRTFDVIIRYYMKNILISCFNSKEERGIANGKNIIQSYRKDENIFGQYLVAASHVFDNHLVNNNPNGELLLLKNFIERLTTMFELPYDTECVKRTEYLITKMKSERDSYLTDNFWQM
jgi:hypothetical protein